MFIKFIGAHGAGKTTMVRALTKQLTGQSCDYWKRVEDDQIIYHICNCGEFIALGKWKEENKCCGMDSAATTKVKGEKFGYKGRLTKMAPLFKDKVVFDEGWITQTTGIIQHIVAMDGFVAYLDYPIDTLYRNITELRGGKTKMESLAIKMKSVKKMYDSVSENDKMTLSNSINENTRELIDVCELQPCNCMQNQKQYIQLQPKSSVNEMLGLLGD